MKLREKLGSAFALRASILAAGAADVVRLFHGPGEGIDGLVIEKFGPALIVQLHEGREVPAMDVLRDALAPQMTALGVSGVYLKVFPRDRAAAGAEIEGQLRDPTPWIGVSVPPEFPVHEYDYRFLVHPYDGYSTGLFLEHRENRQLISKVAMARRVLNLFSYTCSFSVAAAKGGAESVHNVDLSKRYLEWGKANFLANSLSLEPHRFFCSDTFDFFTRAKRQGRRYDMIILDPPTFSRQRRPRRVFQAAEALPDLIAGCLELLEPDSRLFLSINDRRIGLEHLKTLLRSASARRSCEIEGYPGLPPDFPDDPDYSKAILVRFG